MIRLTLAAACGAALCTFVSSALAGGPWRNNGYVAVGVTFPLTPYPYPYAPGPDHRLPPSAYGYPFDDFAGGYYGGGRYREYYAYGRGIGFADFPGPVPRPLDVPIGYGHPLYHRPGAADPPIVIVPPANAAAYQPAYLLVRVPPTAEILLDDAPTRQVGAERLFVTPPLTPGVVHIYDVHVRWQEGGRVVEDRKQVTVRSGEKTEVVFGNGNGNGNALGQRPAK
jgi:uncharacterized protein (TIGR03000 family)